MEKIDFENATFLIIENNTRVREMPIEEAKKVKDWHYNGWDLGGKWIYINNNWFDKIAPLVETLLKRKKKFPIWLIILIWVISFVSILFLVWYGVSFLKEKTSTWEDSKKSVSTWVIIEEVKKPVQKINTWSTQIDKISTWGLIQESIDFRKIQLDLEYQKYEEQKRVALQNLDFSNLSKNFDFLKEDFDKCSEGLKLCNDEKMEKTKNLDDIAMKYNVLVGYIGKECKTSENEKLKAFCTRFIDLTE